MAGENHFDASFKYETFDSDQLVDGRFESCVFEGCSFVKTKLNRTRFIDCQFIQCDLSNALINETQFQDVRFEGCKLMGLRFDQSSPFGLVMHFDNSKLDHSSLAEADLRKSSFLNSSLASVDLTSADVRGLIFEKCDFVDALFENTNLKKVDLRTATNYRIAPENNQIKGAKFSIPGVMGLLRHHDIQIDF